jgi:predicted enzyme related to lactoylglutathione lyase
MNTIRDYDNFFLPAGDLEAARHFYRDVLGLSIKFDLSDKGMVAFRVGHNEPAIIIRQGQIERPAIWLMVDDARAAYQELKQQGVVFNGEPFEIPTGWVAEFTDPSGNSLAITDYRKTEIG